MGLFNYFSEKKMAKEELERKNQEEEAARLLLVKMKAEEEAEAKRLLEIQQAKNREIYRQQQIVNNQIAKRLLETTKPLAVVSVSKVGQSSKYFDYDTPDYAEIGDIVSISEETQFHEDSNKDRDAYVVSYQSSEIGEITASAVERIEESGADICQVLGVISKLEIYDDPPKMSIYIYQTDEDGNLGYRQFHTAVFGVNYPNADGSSRQEIIKGLKVGDRLTLNAVEFDGNPAVEVYAESNKQIGYLKKEIAAEFSEKLKNQLIESVYITEIVRKDDKLYVDIEIYIATK